MKKDRTTERKSDSVNLKARGKIHRSRSVPSRNPRPLIYEQIPTGIVESSLQGKYLNANEEFCKIVGYDKEQLLTLSIKDIIFEQDYPLVSKFYRQLAEGKIPSYNLEKRYVRKDGKIVWVEAKRSLVRNKRGKASYTIGAIRDVTDRRTKFGRQQAAFYQFADQLQHIDSLEDVFDVTLDTILHGLQCRRASILLLDKTGAGQFVAWRGLSERYRHAVERDPLWMSAEKKPETTGVCINDIEAYDLSDSLKAIFKRERIGSLAMFPLGFDHELLGRLVVYFNKPHIFRVDEIEFSLAIARQLATRIERQRIEGNIRENEQRYRRIVETANEGIWEIDKKARTIFVNPRMAEMLGYAVEEMTGCSVLEFMFPEDYPEAEHRLENAKQGIPGQSREFRYRRKDGSVLWTIASRTPKLDAEGNFLGSFAMITDISELKKTEEALRQLNLELERRVQERTAELRKANQILEEEIAERNQAEELLRSWAHIFENAHWGIATALKDTFVMVNPMFAKMHGYRAEELVGRSIYTVLAPESHADTREEIQLAYEKGHHVYENTHVRKDGSTFPALVDTSVVRDSQGNVLYRAINIQDITARKQAEEALNESRQYLRVLSRRLVEVQEEERRAIARELHDRVGQNLSALKLNLGLMENQAWEASKQHEAERLKDSLHLVDETTKLVRDLLAELRPAELDTVGLRAAIQAYVDEFTTRYKIQVVLEMVDEPFPRLQSGVEITLLRIAQEALTNIARHAKADQATVSLRIESNIVYLTVQDNGIGMEVSQGKTTRVSHGLKIMRERAEAFGGTVRIESSEGKGTKVEAIIPLPT